MTNIADVTAILNAYPLALDGDSLTMVSFNRYGIDIQVKDELAAINLAYAMRIDGAPKHVHNTRLVQGYERKGTINSVPVRIVSYWRTPKG